MGKCFSLKMSVAALSSPDAEQKRCCLHAAVFLSSPPYFLCLPLSALLLLNVLFCAKEMDFLCLLSGVSVPSVSVVTSCCLVYFVAQTESRFASFRLCSFQQYFTEVGARWFLAHEPRFSGAE